MNINDVIERVSYFRTEKNISARELSLRINKNEAYINKLECFDFNLPTPVLLDIINALEVTPEEFFAEDYKNYKTKKAILNLLEEITNSVSNEKIVELLNSLKK